MKECGHLRFDAKVAVNRLGDEGGHVLKYIAEISVTCMDCNTPFHFIGPSAGLSFRMPTVNVGATTLNAPIAPGEGPVPTQITYEVPDV